MSKDDYGSLDILTKEVTIGGNLYVLKEADGDADASYRDAITESRVYDENGKFIGVKGIAKATEAKLISHCIVRMDTVGEEGGAKAVIPHIIPEEDVLKWPRRVIRKLFQDIRLMSEYEVEEDEEELLKQIKLAQKKLAILRGTAAKNGQSG